MRLIAYDIILTLLTTVVFASIVNADSEDGNERLKNSGHRGSILPFTTWARHSQAENPSSNDRPNIIFILTDDQDVELGSLKYMPNLLKRFKDEGGHFVNGYTSTPMCCPSRSSILTGMYIHNHKVFRNKGNCSSEYWRQHLEPKTFAPYLKNAGYRTGYFGKYLNKYNGSHIPEGWTEWAAQLMNSQYYNYSVNRNSKIVFYADKFPEDYYSNVLTDDGLQFLRTSRSIDPPPPVFLVLSYPAPHGPEDSSPNHSHKFFHITDHRNVAYDYAPNPDKEWILQATNRMTDVQKKFTDLLMTKRLQTLQTIDEAVEKLIKQLEDLRMLDNTYIFYTSDHGYHLGQFGLVKGKSLPYEFDIKVPYFVRGPGVKRGGAYKQIVANIDFAPTFLDIAGVSVPEHMDGVSLLPLFKGQKKASSREVILIESAGNQKDEEQLEKTTNKLMSLEGISFSHGKFYTSKHEHLENVCQKPFYQKPCKPFQKWACEHDGIRWRLHKCRPNALLHGKFCKCSEMNQKLDLREKRRQKFFLRKHASKSIKKHSVKFLRERNENSKKAAAPALLSPTVKDFKQTESFNLDTKARNDSYEMELRSRAGMQSFIEEEEVLDFDTKIDEIEEEVSYLRGTLNSYLNIHSSSLGKCTSSSCSTKRENLKRDIQRLQHQLQLLKGIRKHLESTLFTPEEDTNHLTINEDASHLSLAEENASREKRAAERFMIRENRAKRRREIHKTRVEKRRRKANENMKECGVHQVHCKAHDNDHWKTPPLWTDGKFCYCLSSGNSTYWCLRTINKTHNYLYCEFTSGLIMYFDLNIDPYQLKNLSFTLSTEEMTEFHEKLKKLKSCTGLSCRKA